MKEFKGTKGKWKIKKTRNGHSMISGKDWDGFCKVYRITEGGYDASSDIHYANAKLIAAAPELLEALQQLSDAISDGNSMLLSEWNLKSKELINKITE